MFNLKPTGHVERKKKKKKGKATNRVHKIFETLSTHGMVVHASGLPANQHSLSTPFINC